MHPNPVEMKKSILFPLLILAACTQNTEHKKEAEKDLTAPNPSTQTVQPVEAEQTDQKAKRAEKWLKDALHNYFAEEMPDRSTIMTETFSAYKGDMMNATYTHGIPLDSLKRKWSYKYEVSHEKTLDGFLINAQDYLNVVIDSCALLSSSDDGKYVFKIVLYDTGFDRYSESDLTVIEYRDAFAIDDSKEYFREKSITATQ